MENLSSLPNGSGTPFPSYRNETKKKTKKTKEKQQKQQRPQQWKKYEKDKGSDFFLGQDRSFEGNLFFLFSLEPMLFQIKKLVLLCALQIKPTLSTPNFQPLFGMWKYVYRSAECLKDLSLFFSKTKLHLGIFCKYLNPVVLTPSVPIQLLKKA